MTNVDEIKEQNFCLLTALHIARHTRAVLVSLLLCLLLSSGSQEEKDESEAKRF